MEHKENHTKNRIDGWNICTTLAGNEARRRGIRGLGHLQPSKGGNAVVAGTSSLSSLKAAGFSDGDFAKVMGGNWLRFFDVSFGPAKA